MKNDWITNVARTTNVSLWGTGGIFQLALPVNSYFVGWEGPMTSGASERWLLFFDSASVPPNNSVPLWAWAISGSNSPTQMRVSLERMGHRPIKASNPRIMLSSTGNVLTLLTSGTIGPATSITFHG